MEINQQDPYQMHFRNSSRTPQMNINTESHEAFANERIFVKSIASKKNTRNTDNDRVRNPSSFYNAYRPIINMAQYFPIFPISNVHSSNAYSFKFTWKSLKILYCFIMVIGCVGILLFNTYFYLNTKFKANHVTRIIFQLSCISTILLFIKIAKQWPQLAIFWDEMEQELAERLYEHRLSTFNLSVKFKIISALIMIPALVEHTLAFIFAYYKAIECANSLNDSDFTAAMFKYQYPEVFSSLYYEWWKGILIQTIITLCTFSWNFKDLFLILISTAITDQFKLLNYNLNLTKGKTMPAMWWTNIHSDYNRLATMTRYVDSIISSTFLLSLSINLYFICVQLLHALNPMPTIVQKMYFLYSFGFLLLKTIAVIFFAAKINEESLVPAPILYSIQCAKYSKEVEIFLRQVTADNISFTVMQFFPIKRILVLNILGTIYTYIFILMKLNVTQYDYQQSMGNTTEACEGSSQHD